ncbi:MAG TPA: Trk system potassium transporter TrkA [Candidatus Marinimicrobia bacterium]|nr:Trk system potassium transporter TrkA [Candidatus Neomarinimicrobiota bacterium]HRS51622.1 Trk system potassium transporter TrkA [Candidatus Neomarinimicrobiota bacterium]HRU92300.1 Trk system potassium transporter TrkA [Candidatus Neomarinimicrobiota bacterium]
MKIIIIGAGEVGYYLAKRLISEDHHVTIIEKDPERHRRVAETLDAIVIHNSGSSPQVLENAGVKSADILIAVTGSDDTNILACIIAKKMGVARCLARVHSEEFSSSKSVVSGQDIGIDLLIHPERTAAEAIIRLVEQSSASQLVTFEDDRLQIISLLIKEDSPVVDQSLEEVAAQYAQFSFLCLAIYREDKTIIPRGKNVYKSGDIAYFIAKEEDIPHLTELIGYPKTEQQHIMILGAGLLGRLVAAVLSREMNVKLIEQDRDTAEEVSVNLPDTLVLQGDGTDIDFLSSERIEEMDCFVAVSGSEKTNLLSGLLAKHLGVKRVIIHVTTNEYIPLMDKIGIDAVVSKNIETVNAIMRYVRRGNVIAVSLFEDIKAEAIELMPRADSDITKHPIKNLDLPEDMIIGALIRQKEIIIPRGDTQIQPQDKVVVFLKPNLIQKVEKYFN